MSAPASPPAPATTTTPATPSTPSSVWTLRGTPASHPTRHESAAELATVQDGSDVPPPLSDESSWPGMIFSKTVRGREPAQSPTSKSPNASQSMSPTRRAQSRSKKRKLCYIWPARCHCSHRLPLCREMGPDRASRASGRCRCRICCLSTETGSPPTVEFDKQCQRAARAQACTPATACPTGPATASQTSDPTNHGRCVHRPHPRTDPCI